MPDTWHYLENQFLSVTKKRRGLADAIYKDHLAKLTGKLPGNAALAPLLAGITAAGAPWSVKYGEWKNARAEYRGTTQAVENLLAILQRKPVGGGRSKIEEWDSKIRAYWSPGDPIYETLLPQGRESFTTGARDQMLDEVGLLAGRIQVQADALAAAAAAASGAEAALLTEQGDALLALKPSVVAFSAQVNAARSVQTQKEGFVDEFSEQLEPLRVDLCVALYRNVGSLMAMLAPHQAEVAGYFDLQLIMAPPAGDDEDEPGNPPTG